MAVFTERKVSDFEDRMIAHLLEAFPREYHAADKPSMRELIQYGVERAEAYGITGERDVCKYIDLMIVFGRDFDQTEWAGAILNSYLESPGNKVRNLCEEAMVVLENPDHNK